MTYLDSIQLARFEEMLKSQLADTNAKLEAINEQLGTQYTAADPLDRASVEEERSLALAQRDRHIKLQREIIAALERIKTGDFGYCEATGDEIGIQRLLARPTSRYTVEAQTRLEQRSKQFSA